MDTRIVHEHFVHNTFEEMSLVEIRSERESYRAYIAYYKKAYSYEDIPLSTIIRQAGYYHAHSPQTFAMRKTIQKAGRFDFEPFKTRKVGLDGIEKFVKILGFSSNGRIARVLVIAAGEPVVMYLKKDHFNYHKSMPLNTYF